MSMASHSGAQRVGHLTDFGTLERIAVMCLRDWNRSPDSPASSAAVSNTRSAQHAFAQMMELGACYGRRPLACHHCKCKCVGADEAVFACLVKSATDGAHEDAAMLAALIVRPDMAGCFATLAAQFGVALSTDLRINPIMAADPTVYSPALH